MNKLFQQRIARMLIVFMITVMLPVRVFAAGEDGIVTTAQEVSENINIESEELEAKIVGEVKEKREKNIKYFFKDNGTYEAAIYNTPVHYLENGVWKDIDNSLVEEKDEENSNVLGNKENVYKVKIAKNSNAKKLVTIAKDSYELSWNIENPKESPVVVQALEEEKLNEDTEKETLYDLETNKIYKKKSETEKEKIKKNAIENEKKKIVKNTSSSVKFTEIFEGVDISYDILSDNVKENIIINKPIANSTFKFNLYIKNLVPKLQKDKTIVFYDKNDTSKAVFMMKAPFMVDAKNQHSENVEISLQENETGYALLLTPDKEWLNDSSRAFPVVLDPPVKTNLGVNSIEDSFVASNLPAENKYNSILLGVGNGSASGVTRSYLKFELPQDLKKPGSVVVNAKLNLALLTDNLQARYIDVHKVLTSWDSRTITWNNKPDYYRSVEDYEVVKGTSGTWFDWDITGIVRDYYKTGVNNGVMLKAEDETTGYNEFLSSDCSDAYAQARPQIIIQYVSNSGLEDYWTYHSQSAGRAGTGYINDASGNVVFVHNDLSMNGNRMPVTINHVYNSNDRASSMGYGNGWRLNLNQRVTPKNFLNETAYEYLDEDGTKHYFFYNSTDAAYKDESGIDLTLRKNADGGFTIEDKDKNQLIFNAGGYLLKIQDKNGNRQLLSYNGTTLKSITDGAGRPTTFNILDNGYLVGIIDPSGRETKFAYNGINLWKITYPDGKVTTYDYDSNNNLKSITNIDGYKISYDYYPTSPYAVSKAQELGTDGAPGASLNLAYGTNTTIFTQIINANSGIRRNIYQFNDYGNTISIKENDDATALSYKFNKDLNRNKLALESKLQKTIINYLKNHNVEITNDNWTASIDAIGSSGSAEFTTEDKYIGNQSLKINKLNSIGSKFYSQSVTLQKGKTYTFSGYVKTKAVSGINKSGAGLFVKYKNEAGVDVIAQSNVVTGDSNWQRVEATFTIPDGATSADVEVRAGINLGTGTAYFDCFQLEDGEMSNRYNLVENSNFNLNSGSQLYWNKTSNSGTNDKVVNVDSKNVFQFTGSANLKKSVNQTIKISGKKGDSFVLSGWAMGKSVPVSEEGERYFALDIGIRKTDGTYQYKVVPFNEDSTGWQYAADAVIAEADYTEVNVYGLYYNNLNTVNFDNIQLYREEFGQSYTYDDKGNLISTQDLAAQKSKFEYDSNNNLIKAVDPKGGEFKYGYDTAKINLTSATSAENVVYSFQYDSYGNPKTAKVGSDSLFIDSEAFYTANGNYITELKDSSGNSIKYSYNETKGTLDTVQDGKGKVTTYKYNNDMDRLENVYKTVDEQQVKNSYEYENDKIKSVIHNGFSYKFDYDPLGNNKTVSVEDQNLITNTYDKLTGNLTESEYGNGHITSIIYDTLGRITGRKYNGVEKFRYSYDASGNLGKHEDLENGVSYRYFYDMSNRLTKIEDSNKNNIEYNFDLNSNLNTITEKINDGSYHTKYEYDKDNKLKSIFYDRFKVESSKIERFSLDGILIGDKGTKPYSENGKFENDEAGGVALAARSGTATTDATKVLYNLGMNKASGTMGVWFNTSQDKTTRHVIGNQKDTAQLFNVYIDSNNQLNLSIIDKGVFRNVITLTNSIAKETWYFVTLSWYMEGDTLKCKLYLNGKLSGEGTVLNPVNFTGGVTALGSSINGTQHLNGRLKQFTFSKEVLSNEEIALMYASRRASTGTSVSLNYDALGRLIDKSVNPQNVSFKTTYEYQAGIKANSTTNKVSIMSNNGEKIGYAYDKNGNIETITYNKGEGSENEKTIRYTYNELNELIREENQVLNKTITYSYDVGGNILKREELNHTTGVTEPHDYKYEDTNWKDKLTSFDGKAITYDAIGNPLSDGSYTYTWENGRQLKSIAKENLNISFKYNDSGIRTEKTVNGKTTKYHLLGNKVTFETDGENSIYYTYDSNDNLVSMNLNGVEYYYIRNAQGDITGLFDKTGTQVVSYTYDSWGQLISIKDKDGNDVTNVTTHVGYINPYRYRGYRYDSET
ncbi:MAG: DNRLRE domain-containing protein, partial [Clostridium lundense]|nr:DNRLRE domain-containing protein [Clostridium lundense]